MSTQEKQTQRSEKWLPGRGTSLSYPWVEPLWRTAAAFVLAHSVVLGNCSPFALGLLGASGGGLCGVLVLLGAVAGYLASMGLVEALRYIAAGMLIFSVSFAFYDIRLYRTEWFMGLSCALATGLTGFVYLSAGGWSREGFLCLGSETVLAGVSCWLLQGLDAKRPARRRGGIGCLTAAVLSAAAGITLPGVGNLAAVAGTAVVLTVARRGSGAGAVCGAGVGLVLTCSGAGGAAVSGALAFGGCLAGWEALPRGRLWRTLLGTGGSLAALLWMGGGLSELWALAAGGVLCLALPDSLLRLEDALPAGGVKVTVVEEPPDSVQPEPLEESARFRLEEQAAAFQSLYEQLREGIARNPTGESTRTIFERVSQRVCESCPQYDRCWKREPMATWDDLNTVLAAMQERGAVKPEDYPERFRRSCRAFDAFRTAANEELFAFWTRRQYRMRLRESRSAVCRQYAQISLLLKEAADTLGSELHFEATGSAAAQRAVTRLGGHGKAGLWLDHRGRRVLVVSGDKVEPLKTAAGLKTLRAALGVPMELWDSAALPHKGLRLTFRQAPPYTAAVGVALRRKEGQSVSGDNGSWFQDERGNLWVTVCDGMGSGEAASAESSLVLHLVEDFLHAHIEPEAALTTLTSALALRGEVDGGFTTVDLLQIDLFTGVGALYKLGGAPSYLRRKGAVSRVNGSALPPGLGMESENRPDVSRFRLGGGDCAVLLSDGVTDGTGDFWLRTLLEHWTGQNPRTLAEEILNSPQTRTSDDCTVAVVQLTG